jgi:fucose 4-O-acetylase-like acetyltransferase
MSGRYHALDSMRASMMLLGIYLHVVVGYSGNGRWPYIDPHPTPALDWSLGLIHAFRMPAFFAMAGFFGALLWERRGPAAFLSNRARRIVLPFLLFWPAMFPWFYPTAKRLHPLHLWFLEYLILLYAVGAAAAATVRAPWIHTAFRWVLPKWYAPLVFASFSWPVLVAMRGTLKDCDGIMPEPLILAAYVVPSWRRFRLSSSFPCSCSSSHMIWWCARRGWAAC